MSPTDQQEKQVLTPPQNAIGGLALTEKIRRLLLQDPHRAYAAEDILRGLKLLFPKDPQKQAEAMEQVTSSLSLLLEEGFCRDIAPDVFKARLFFDQEKNIEHAFIGGMGNVHYRFNAASLFCLNLGVLTIFFLRNEQGKGWRVSVADPTLGKKYCFVRPFCDGVHILGTAPKVADGESGWAMEGKYIDKTQATLILSENQIEVMDHHTVRGSRINHLTDAGFKAYFEAANRFLESTDVKGQGDIVKRGRFALEQLLQHHKNFETSFLSATIDYILLKKSG